jgi:hypothetical protein
MSYLLLCMPSDDEDKQHVCVGTQCSVQCWDSIVNCKVCYGGPVEKTCGRI